MYNTRCGGLLALCVFALVPASLGVSAQPSSSRLALNVGDAQHCSVDTAAGGAGFLKVPVGKFTHPDYNADCECERRGSRTKWSCKYCAVGREVPADGGGRGSATSADAPLPMFTTRPGLFVHPDHGGSCTCQARSPMSDRYSCAVCRLTSANGTTVTVPSGSFIHPDDGGQCKCSPHGSENGIVFCDYCPVQTRASGLLMLPVGRFKHPDFPGPCRCRRVGRAVRYWTCNYCTVETKANGTVLVAPGNFRHPDHPGDCQCPRGRGGRGGHNATCKFCTIPTQEGDVVVAPGNFQHPDSGKSCMCTYDDTQASWACERNEDEAKGADEDQHMDTGGNIAVTNIVVRLPDSLGGGQTQVTESVPPSGASATVNITLSSPVEVEDEDQQMVMSGDRGLVNVTVDLPGSQGSRGRDTQSVPASGSAVRVKITIPTADSDIGEGQDKAEAKVNDQQIMDEDSNQARESVAVDPQDSIGDGAAQVTEPVPAAGPRVRNNTTIPTRDTPLFKPQEDGRS